MIAIIRNNVMTLYDNVDAFYADEKAPKNNFISLNGIIAIYNKSNEEIL